jgi:CRISP-associated protein Cas1
MSALHPQLFGGDGEATVAPPDVAGRTVYIATRGLRLAMANGRLVVSDRETGFIRMERPLKVIDRIVLSAPTSLTTPLLAACIKHGIDVIVLSGTGGWIGRVQGRCGRKLAVAEAQILARRDAARSLAFAREFVRAKMESQRVLLRRRFNRTKNGEVQLAERRLSRLLRRIDSTEDLQALNGLEGIAARTYFGVWRHMLRRYSGFVFKKRSRRPPKDATNALLGYVYALLMSECEAACQSAGLIPEAGLLHRGPGGGPCIALDLMEVFRPSLADVVVLRLINRKTLCPEADFEHRNGGVYLVDTGRRRVFEAWDERRQEAISVEGFVAPLPWHRVVHHEARRLAEGLREQRPPSFITLR